MPSGRKARRYWDSATCIGWLADEPDKVALRRSVLDAAERGEVEIVVSALTLAEVLFVRGGERIPVQKRDKIRDFFRREYVLVVDVTRRVAELAQDVVWERGVKPKDAVHVATALIAGAQFFDTFDDGLRRLSGTLGGSPALAIGPPAPPEQQEIDFTAGPTLSS